MTIPNVGRIVVYRISNSEFVCLSSLNMQILIYTTCDYIASFWGR